MTQHSRDAEGRFGAAFFFASFQKKLAAAQQSGGFS
jgi:hypothetical protein